MSHTAPPYDYDPDAILADPASHPKHIAYAMINIGIRDHGEDWSKCANCGDPYQLTEDWGDPTVCSRTCGNEYVAYLNSPDAGF
jgi:hypothetical protein